ncbi:reticulon-4 isoform X1 [Pseudophryne corroboree]|uniref:reticulon-4 isoform X1 n=1 Tax=Pseudophryne corroboree TaxID=495146 RepID=UPI003081A881
MEDQSSLVSSSRAGQDAPETPEEEHYGRRWTDMDDVLDLTGGAGQFSHHPTFSISPPVKPAEEDDEEDRRSYSDSLEPSPEDEEPDSIGSSVRVAPAITPSAPLAPAITPSAPEEEPHRPAAPSSGSVDVNLFPLPASSAPLMHSSAAHVMDFQQPSGTVSAGQEELSSLLLQSTSLPPLFPLSPDYSKDRAFPADSTAPEALQGTVSDVYALSQSLAGSSVVGKFGHDMETDYSEVGYKHAPGDTKEDLIFSERGHAVEHPTSQPETLYGDYTKVYTQSAKETFSGMLKSVGPPHEEFADFKEGQDEQYVDFKPFMGTRAYEMDYEPKYVAVDLKSNISALNFESIVKPEEKYSEEKDLDLSDDISPVSPDAISDSSNYEPSAPLQQTSPLGFPASPASGNKTDEEKKMEGIETRMAFSHLGSNIATVNPFFEPVDREGGYVTTQSASGNAVTQVPNKPEGLTPDIVQEAYESEVYETGIPKLAYEPKIDLVPTAAKTSVENVSPTLQNTPLFEDSDAVSSPVLPDIVMEAPLTSAPVGLNTMAPQPDVSPVRHVTLVSEEKIKFESEKPPSYEEATNKGSVQDQRVPAPVKTKEESPVEEPETPYISIACDLIKETIPEQLAKDFSKALKTEFDSHFTPHFDDSSPESEQSEPSYKHWEAETIKKDSATAVLGTVKSQDFTPEKEPESIPKWKELPPSKAYLESYQPTSYLSEDTDLLADETVTNTSNQEKPLQMEAFGKAVFSEDLLPITAPSHFGKPAAVAFADEIVPKVPRGEQVKEKEGRQQEDRSLKDQPKKKEDTQDRVKESIPSSDKGGHVKKEAFGTELDEPVSRPLPPAKDPTIGTPSSKEKQESKDPSVPAPLVSCTFQTSVVDLLYWRDIKKSGAVFGASLFLLLSLTVFSIVSVSAYIALGLLSVTISFRIYKGVLQAIQKSDEGHPFKSYLESNVAVSEDLVQKYCNVALGHINCTLKELRRLFLVEDLVDSLKFAVLMWVFTYIGALFNGLTLLILALISLFSIPVIYERHQTQVDHYLALISKNVKSTTDLIVSKVPGLKRKTE